LHVAHFAPSFATQVVHFKAVHAMQSSFVPFSTNPVLQPIVLVVPSARILHQRVLSTDVQEVVQYVGAAVVKSNFLPFLHLEQVEAVAEVHVSQSAEQATHAPLASAKYPLLQVVHLLKSVVVQPSQLATAHLVESSHL